MNHGDHIDPLIREPVDDPIRILEQLPQRLFLLLRDHWPDTRSRR